MRGGRDAPDAICTLLDLRGPTYKGREWRLDGMEEQTRRKGRGGDLLPTRGVTDALKLCT